MTEHAAFAALPVPWHAAFQEHSRAGCEQVHAVFWFRCAVLWSSHLPGPLHINARQGAVYWCRQHGTRGARTSTFLRASRGLARARRLRPVGNRCECAATKVGLAYRRRTPWSRALASVLHARRSFSGRLYVQPDGGRVEHGRRPLLKPVPVGLREQRRVGSGLFHVQ